MPAKLGTDDKHIVGQVIARPGIACCVIGRHHAIGASDVAIEHVVFGHEPIVDSLLLGSRETTRARVAAGTAVRRAATRRSTASGGTRTGTAVRARRTGARTGPVRAAGLTRLLRIPLLLLFGLVNDRSHAVIGKLRNDLGVGEHDGLAVCQRDLVGRPLALVRGIDVKHGAPDHARPRKSSCRSQVAFGLAPNMQLARSMRLYHGRHRHAISRNTGYDQYERARQQHIRPRRQAQPAPHAHRGAMLCLSAPGPHAFSSNKNTPLKSGAFFHIHI